MKLEYTNKISRENETSKNEYIDSSNHTDKFVTELNDNKPAITDEDEKQLGESVDPFSDLDELGRCGTAFARIDNETCSQGQKNRPKIKCKPTGFPTEKENSINGNPVFQRCHLIGYQLFTKRNGEGEAGNANLKRIFTGTRFMNNEMLYRENIIANYVNNKNHYVLYRVTPYFDGCNQLACGVQMEAKFMDGKKEDKEQSFNIFVYNKQPGIIFDYKTGEIFSEKSKNLLEKISGSEYSYVLNKKKKKFHIKWCASVCDIDEKCEFVGKRDVLIEKKYRPCRICDSCIK